MKPLILFTCLVIASGSVLADTSIILTNQQALAALKDKNQQSITFKTLFSKGIFSKKAFIGDNESYQGYYINSKPASFHKFNVAAYQTIYVKQYVGCCPGNTNSLILVPTNSTDLDGLESFAKSNKCELDTGGGEVLSSLPDSVALKLINKFKTKNFFTLTCEVQE